MFQSCLDAVEVTHIWRLRRGTGTSFTSLTRNYSSQYSRKTLGVKPMHNLLAHYTYRNLCHYIYRHLCQYIHRGSWVGELSSEKKNDIIKNIKNIFINQNFVINFFLIHTGVNRILKINKKNNNGDHKHLHRWRAQCISRLTTS